LHLTHRTDTGNTLIKILEIPVRTEYRHDVCYILEAVDAVGGGFEVARLGELFGEHDLALPKDLEATTLGGLVTEMAGRIPLPGEVVETEGLRLEVMASSDRLIDRLRLSMQSRDEDENAGPTPRLAS
jgi:CBS domain containing-hemolysin-like protein